MKVRSGLTRVAVLGRFPSTGLLGEDIWRTVLHVIEGKKLHFILNFEFSFSEELIVLLNLLGRGNDSLFISCFSKLKDN